MTLAELFQRLPTEFVGELLAALPAPDRREVLKVFKARVKMDAGNLKRAVRQREEARKVHQHLLKFGEADDYRAVLNGWLLQRAGLVIACLDAWGIEHQGGMVEDFEWVDGIDAEKARKAVAAAGDKFSLLEILVYFTYLELPGAEEAIDVEAALAAAPSAAEE